MQEIVKKNCLLVENNEKLEKENKKLLEKQEQNENLAEICEDC